MSAAMSKLNESTLNLGPWQASLCEAAKEVFSIMLGAELADPQEVPPIAAPAVTAMVGLAGPVSGVLSLRCSTAVCTEIAARMLGLTGADAEAHRSDAVGETCNMVAGAFKAKLPELQDNCMLSVPTVITGDDYAVHSLAVGKRTEVPLAFQDHVIWLAVEISS